MKQIVYITILFLLCFNASKAVNFQTSGSIKILEISKEKFLSSIIRERYIPQQMDSMHALIVFQKFLSSNENLGKFGMGFDSTAYYTVIEIPSSNQDLLNFINIGNEGFSYSFLITEDGKVDSTFMNGLGCLSKNLTWGAEPDPSDGDYSYEWYSLTSGKVQKIAELKVISDNYKLGVPPKDKYQTKINIRDVETFIPQSIFCDENDNFYVVVYNTEFGMEDIKHQKFFKIRILN